MKIEEIRETAIWSLYEKGRSYHSMTGIYTDTDRNYRMYNGDQWDGAKLGDVAPVQKNFIKPIVKYKVAVIHNNLYMANYSSENFANPIFYQESDKYCKMLNRYARRIWERDKIDIKGREVTKDSAINDEGIIYVDFDKESMFPMNEVVDKNDVYYGNENDDDIQKQPYILIKKRMPVSNAIEYALAHGMSEDKKDFIIGDMDNFEQSGDAAKIEKDNMATIVLKLYKEDGTVHYSCASRWVTIVEDEDTGLTMYPIAHLCWEKKKGSARGEGEVRQLIPNQIEVNRTEMRRVLTVKSQAYPQRVVDASKLQNPDDADRIGATLKTNGQTVDDVRKVVGSIPPSQMSPDVKMLVDDLINVTRDLAGAGDIATGQVNPETASGRAILAVQQASQAPMTEQKESYKDFLEELAKIWLEYLIVHSPEGVNLEEEIKDPMTGKDTIRVVKVPQSALVALKASVKIDITPKSPFDKFAQEQTIENLLTHGYFTAQKVGELRAYAEALDDDSVAPKIKILEICDKIEADQQKIAQIQAKAQAMQQAAQMFMNNGLDGQASQIADARMQMMAGQQPSMGQMEPAAEVPA